MNNDQIIEMARRFSMSSGGKYFVPDKDIIAFARLIEKQVREEVKPEPEPVAWMTEAAWGTSVALEKPNFGATTWKAPTPKVIPLYTKDQT